MPNLSPATVLPFYLGNAVPAISATPLSTPAPALPVFAGFGASNRLMFDRCDILRFVQIGTEDGTPISDVTVVTANVPCRLDYIGGVRSGRRRDQVFRTQTDVRHQNDAQVFMAVDVDVRDNDVLRFANGKEWRITQIEVAYQSTSPHHLELHVYLIEGES